MTKRFTSARLASFALAAAFTHGSPALAQVAGGSTTVGVSVVESTALAMGWSAKQTLLGRTVHDDAGQKIGKIEDLIVSPDRNVSFALVGAGGFIGIGRTLVMAGATAASIKAMPTFEYAVDTTQRDKIVAAAEQDIAKGRSRIAELERQAGAAAMP